MIIAHANHVIIMQANHQTIIHTNHVITFTLQISFDRSVVVTSVLLQGEGEEGWVTKFAVQSSKDGLEWRYVVEDGLSAENPLIFRGNQDGDSVAEVTLCFMK